MFRLLSYSIVGLILSSCTPEPQKISQEKLEEQKAVYQAAVSSVSPEATEVGVQILRNGGNAFDASIAVQFALAVTYPRAGNLGGGGFAVLSTSTGDINSLDFREKAPLKASADMYLDNNGMPIKGKSLIGALAAGVPGTVMGMWEIHQKYGSKKWEELLSPAIKLAGDGFRLSKYEVERLKQAKNNFKKANKNQKGPFLDHEFVDGELFVQEVLAKSLQLIADSGVSIFYGGEVGRLMVDDIKGNEGIISLEDLRKYQAIFRSPVVGKFKEYEVLSMGPPSSGGIALIQLLQGSRQLELGKYGHNETPTLHFYTEMMRRVYADRSTKLGDPDFVPIQTNKLIGSNYLWESFDEIDKHSKTNSEDVMAGKSERIESVETTHFSVLDKEGNAVSMTITLNSSYGCKLWLPSVGFFLNNEMDDFVVKKGVANQFGLIGGQANAIEAEKRMLSSMTPTIVRKNKKPILIVGTPGGSTIITTVFQTVMNVLEFEMPLQEAVDAPRMHHQWQPDVITVEEGRFDSVVLVELGELGHEIKTKPGLGIVNAISVSENGETSAVSDDSRYMGSAVVIK